MPLSGAVPSTLMPHGMRSGAAWLASVPPEEVDGFLAGLSDNALAALPWLFPFWALPHQMPPEGAWRTWVIMGGRGAGKTRAGAEWVRAEVEGGLPSAPGRSRRIALVGETMAQTREVMIFGDSGILACTPPDRRPEWEAGRQRLVWPNGAVAQVFSAHDPESLRGPQFDAAWVDELAKWPKADEAWTQLQFALRLGDAPRQVVTTTPRNVAVLKAILKAPSTVITHAPTQANRAYLAASFLEEIEARFGGSRLGAQEIEGRLVADAAGALWTSEMLNAARTDDDGPFSRIVVAVDPSVSGKGDACGIVVVGAVTAGRPQDWRAVVLADATVEAASPQVWAQAAIAAMDRFGADRLVAEGNQGGRLVEDVLRAVDPLISLRLVHATAGKAARAMPVAALYEQGRVRHRAGLQRLEEQMCLMTPEGWQGSGSPDRLDALVWALTDLVIEPARRFRDPHVRTLG